LSAAQRAACLRNSSRWSRRFKAQRFHVLGGRLAP
jgi:hypothetical protein